MVFSLILVVQKSTQTRIKIIGRLPNTDKWVPVDEDEAAQEEIPGVVSLASPMDGRHCILADHLQLVVRIREALSFANTGQLKERLRRVSEMFCLPSEGADTDIQLELYGAQKSHPSDAPRRESAKAIILHMGDVSTAFFHKTSTH